MQAFESKIICVQTKRNAAAENYSSSDILGTTYRKRREKNVFLLAFLVLVGAFKTTVFEVTGLS